MAARGTSFERYYTASAMCSSARSVIYTGQHLPLTEIYDNDNMPYVRPLDPELGTLRSMLRSAGYYTTYQGKWHPSNAYITQPRPHHRCAGTVRVQRVQWLGRHRRRRVGRTGTGSGHRRTGRALAAQQGAGRLPGKALVHGRQLRQPARHHELRLRRQLPGSAPVRARPCRRRAGGGDIPVYQRRWDFGLPTSLHDDLSGAAPAVAEYARRLDTVFGPVADDQHWYDGVNLTRP
ncbi:sulfatase-like hydrolase/transferase [Streptomyces sp. NPDC005046]